MSRIQVRIPQELKVQLEQQALKDGIDFPEWLRINLHRLQQQYPGQIVVEDRVKIPNPYPMGYPNMGYPNMGYPNINAPSYGYNPYMPYPYFQPTNSLDKFIDNMGKMVQAKLMKELLQDKATPEEFMRAMQRGGLREGGDGWSFENMQKMQMLQNQHEQRMASINRDMMMAERQLEAARSHGDVGAESKALDTITALMAAQQGQSQNFMQQLMALQQTNSNSQQSMFTTALQTQRQQEADSANTRREYDARIEAMRTEMWTNMMSMMQQNQQIEVNHLRTEMERIRNEKGKDTLQQLKEIVEMRESSPIMKAAFDAAFGVQHESTIGKIIPQLKELGLDKTIEKVGGALVALATRPRVPKPSAIPTPGQTSNIPPPQPLEQLKLPTGQPNPTNQSFQNPQRHPTSQPSIPKSISPQTQTSTQPKPPAQFKTAKRTEDTRASPQGELPPESIGYTNLDVEGRKKSKT